MKRVLHKYLGIKAEALAGHEAVDVQGGSTDAAMMVTAWWPLRCWPPTPASSRLSCSGTWSQ